MNVDFICKKCLFCVVLEVRTCQIALVSSTNMMIFVVFGVRAVVNVKIKVFMMIITITMIIIGIFISNIGY